ncbi:MAG: hypothetical protein Q8O55_02935 [Dehalococcoidales bacterium]|nr:hypothetical protein [Dehalococcoidales bacterium]
MSKITSTRVPNDLIGIAGVHWVVSELSRRGLIAMPTIRNTSGIDVLVTTPDGSAQAVLQVKTAGTVKDYQEDGRQWWPMPAPDKCLKGTKAFYVFVRWREDQKSFEAFLDSTKTVAKQVQDNLVEDRKLGHKDFPCWGIPKDLKEQKRLANKWLKWHP